VSKKPYKPSPDHPWNLKARAQVLAAQGKKRPQSDLLVLQALREDEERFDREETAELERGIKEFFE